MKIRLEVGDGRPARFKLFDGDTGRRIGLVQSVELNVNIQTAVMRFEVMLTRRSEFNGDEYWTSADLKSRLSPWLRGSVNDKQEFIFEDLDDGGVPFEEWIDSLQVCE